MHTGKMVRVSPQFFEFICKLEVLHSVNLTPTVALMCKGRLFQKVDEVVRNNKGAKELFLDCLPPGVDNEERKIMLEVYDFILKKFSTMRAGDVLRKMKAKTVSTLGDGFSTRTAVQSAMLATEGKKPSAIKSKEAP